MIRRHQQRADGHAGSQRVGGKVHALRAFAAQYSLDTASLASSIQELIADPNVGNGYIGAVGALQPGGPVEARNRLVIIIFVVVVLVLLLLHVVKVDSVVTRRAEDEIVTGNVNRRAQAHRLVPLHRVVHRRFRVPHLGHIHERNGRPAVKD
jgi:competence protein ComGC